MIVFRNKYIFRTEALSFCLFFSQSAEVESRTQDSRPRLKTAPSKTYGTLPRPRTGMLEAKKKGHRRKCSPKKGLQNFFQAKKSLKKFHQAISNWGKQKRSSQIFRKVSGVFQQNFNGSKIGLSSRRGQANFWGLETSRPRPRIWPLRGRPRASKCVLEDVIEVKDVLKAVLN